MGWVGLKNCWVGSGRVAEFGHVAMSGLDIAWSKEKSIVQV